MRFLVRLTRKLKEQFLLGQHNNFNKPINNPNSPGNPSSPRTCHFEGCIEVAGTVRPHA